MLSSILKRAGVSKRSQEEEVEAKLVEARRSHSLLSDVIKFYLRCEWPESDGASAAVEMELDNLHRDYSKSLARIVELQRTLRTLRGGR